MTNHQTTCPTDRGFPGDLWIAIDRSGSRRLGEQLEDGLREAIRAGRLAAGTVLPASRTLATELGLSRSVVVEAYGQLTAEGYLEARQGSGTRVRRVEASTQIPDASAHRRPARDARLLAGLPDPASFPRAQWQRHYRAALSELPDAALGYPPTQGAIELRTALARYLGRVRAVRAAPEQMIVCSGFAQGLTLLCRVLRGRGARRLAIEDPCFPYHRQLVANAGLEPVPVPVDVDGIDVEQLSRHDVAAVLVAPAHSCPSGAALAPARRAALVTWAHDTGAFVIEDDYDAEFRYDRAPIGALQGLAPDQVVYGGSVSKTLSPAVRIGWLMSPSGLLADLRREKLYDDMAGSVLEQHALARFIEQGGLARHLRRVRPLYRRRRDAALHALAINLPDAIPEGIASGLHLYVRLPAHCDEGELVRAAGRRGVEIQGAAGCWAQPQKAPPALVLGYGAASEAAIERGIAGLGAAYATLQGS